MSNTELRNKILQEVSKLPEEALSSLDEFINGLPQNKSVQPNPIMELSGIWNDLNDENLDILTAQLLERRHNNRRLDHE
jgi:hypothetical protein